MQINGKNEFHKVGRDATELEGQFIRVLAGRPWHYRQSNTQNTPKRSSRDPPQT